MRTAYLLTGDAHQAEDLLQSVLLKVSGPLAQAVRRRAPRGVRAQGAAEPVHLLGAGARPELPTADPPDRQSHDDATLERIVMRRALPC